MTMTIVIVLLVSNTTKNLTFQDDCLCRSTLVQVLKFRFFHLGGTVGLSFDVITIIID